MKNKKLTKQGKLTILIIALALIVVAATVAGVVSAKYIKQLKTNGKITISAKLAKSIKVYEHQLEREDTGLYTLDESKTVTENSYYLMPGVDVPKDPVVYVEDYTGMPAYLFIKVESTLPSTVTFKIAQGWTALEGQTGVYYRELGQSNVANPKFDIIEDNILIVSDQLAIPRPTLTDIPYTLNFSAYIAQKVSNQTVAQAYAAANPNN